VGTSYELRFSPEESSVVALGRNVVLWEADRSKRIASAHPLAHPSSVDFSPVGDRLIVKATSGECVLLDARSLQELRRFGGEEWGEGAAPLFCEDGSQFVVGSWNGDLLVRSTETGEIVHRESDQGMITELVGSPDRRLVAYAAENEVRLRPWPFTEHPSTTVTVMPKVHGLALRDDKLALIGGEPLSISLWLVSSGQMLASREATFGGIQMGVTLSPAGDVVLVE
jgi:WD40 repeat protein